MACSSVQSPTFTPSTLLCMTSHLGRNSILVTYDEFFDFSKWVFSMMERFFLDFLFRNGLPRLQIILKHLLNLSEVSQGKKQNPNFSNFQWWSCKKSWLFFHWKPNVLVQNFLRIQLGTPQNLEMPLNVTFLSFSDHHRSFKNIFKNLLQFPGILNFKKYIHKINGNF